MATLFDYLKSLLPKFGKDKVAELARQTQNELTSFVIPSYIEAEKGLGARAFKAPKILELTNILKRNVKVDKPNDNIISIIRKKLEQISKNNQIIESHIVESLEDDVVIAGVTILKVNLLRLIETTNFVARYSSKLLNYIYILETAAVGGDMRYIQDSLSKGEIIWLEERFLDYAVALGILSRTDREISSILNSLPEAIVEDSSSNAALATIGETKFDPFGFRRLSGFTYSPIFHFRLIAANYQANKYKEQKELKTVLQLRLLNLKNSQTGTPNPKLEREIEYVQRRIDRISDDIRRAEQE